MSTKKHPILRLVHHLKPLGVTVVMPTDLYQDPETIKNLADAIDDGELPPSELKSVTLALYEAIKPI